MLHPAILRHVCIVRPTRKYLPRNYFPVSRTCVSVSAIISITARLPRYTRAYIPSLTRVGRSATKSGRHAKGKDRIQIGLSKFEISRPPSSSPSLLPRVSVDTARCRCNFVETMHMYKPRNGGFKYWKYFSAGGNKASSRVKLNHRDKVSR